MPFDCISQKWDNSGAELYTVKIRGIVCVLHAFQKKSKKGIATPQADIELIRRRFNAAKDAYGGQ